MDCVDFKPIKQENVIEKGQIWKHNYFVIYVTGGIPFTRLLLHINSTLLHDSFSQSSHITSLTFCSDFDTFLTTREFFLEAQLLHDCVLTRAFL